MQPPKRHMQPVLKIWFRPLNAKLALTIRDLCPPMFPEAAIHATAPYWALTFVQELRLMALIFTPTIVSLMACL